MAAEIRRGLRVLLVSDQPAWLAELLSHLEPEGYAIGVAADTASAWLVLTAEPPPELVLLDQGLAQQSALPLVSRMRQSAINVPLRLLMQHSDAPFRAQALDHGVDDCLSLPFWPGELLARVRAMLRPEDTLSAHALREAVWGEDHAQLPVLLEVYAERLLKIVNTSGDCPVIESQWCIREGSSPRLDALRLAKG